MPMTISYLSRTNNQQPAKRFQDTTFEINESSSLISPPQSNMYASEQINLHGSCFIWSSNLLVFGAWLQINCSTKIAHPFIICEKILNLNQKQQMYKRPSVQCTPSFLEFNEYCIRILAFKVNQPNTNVKRFYESKVDYAVLMRILTAWTMPLYIGQKRNAIHVVKWREIDACVCYTSIDTMYMENKSWYHDTNCNCNTQYPSLIIASQRKTIIPNQLFLCEDGNFKYATYLCDGEKDCHINKSKDELNCDHICSTHNNCVTGCIFPDCFCTQLHHQCTLGGCVHQTFVCDGVVQCPGDDSDELMCQYQIAKNTNKKRLHNDAYSLCNSFSNETYPNNEICLLTRDQYGVTEHCGNTEHLRYCLDFSCPNHYKCFESYCIPLHLVCDGVEDCPTGQDEEHCGEFSCHGYFQCKATHLCLHLNYLCDGVVDCPVHRDDEQFCDSFQCPKDCDCIGFTVACIKVTKFSLHYISKYKNRKAIILASNSATIHSAITQFSYFPWLLVLNLTGAQFVQNLYPEAFIHMPQLRILDLTNIRIVLDKGSKFRYMNSLKHLYLIRSRTSTLYLNTFQLPSLTSLHLQYSKLHFIENEVFCFQNNLRIINLSFNEIEHISVKTFECLKGLHILDIRNNKLTTIQESALDYISIVLFSGHITICCYLSSTSSCVVGEKTISSITILNECQSILSHHVFIKVIYVFMGLITTTVSLIFIIKLLSNRRSNIKVRKFILNIAICDTFNGIYIFSVFVCDIINELFAYWVAQRKNVLDLLLYLSVVPRISMMVTRFEHLLLTVGMYVATCHVFSDFDAYIRVARVISWLVCVSYAVIEIFILRHVGSRRSVMWQPYHETDYSTVDIISILALTGYELIVCIVNIFICTHIYKSVKRNEKRIQSKRIQKHQIVAKRLICLTLGRVLLTIFSLLIIVLLRFHLSLAIVVKEMLISFIVPSSTLINFVTFYNYVW